MMDRPRLLDLFCGAGGAAMGYYRAGFEVTGVDIVHQPRYPFNFIQDDAIRYARVHGHEYDAIHASPPCQRWTNCQRIRKQEHPDLIDITRRVLLDNKLTWVIENVKGAPLINPVWLCGQNFPELSVYRHRGFESSFYLHVLPHQQHRYPLQKMGRPPEDGKFMHVVGNFSGIKHARQAMGIDWMTRNELREAIPPAYTEYVGKFLMKALLR